MFVVWQRLVNFPFTNPLQKDFCWQYGYQFHSLKWSSNTSKWEELLGRVVEHHWSYPSYSKFRLDERNLKHGSAENHLPVWEQVCSNKPTSNVDRPETVCSSRNQIRNNQITSVTLSTCQIMSIALGLCVTLVEWICHILEQTEQPHTSTSSVPFQVVLDWFSP